MHVVEKIFFDLLQKRRLSKQRKSANDIDREETWKSPFWGT